MHWKCNAYTPKHGDAWRRRFVTKKLLIQITKGALLPYSLEMFFFFLVMMHFMIHNILFA